MDDLKYQPVEHNHEEFLRKSMVNNEFKAGYEALGPKYALIRELLAARQRSGMTQEAVALKIGTSKTCCILTTSHRIQYGRYFALQKSPMVERRKLG